MQSAGAESAAWLVEFKKKETKKKKNWTATMCAGPHGFSRLIYDRDALIAQNYLHN